MEIFTRSYYSAKIEAWLGKGQIIVLTGQRRVGKSFVLKDFVQRYKDEADANIIYVNKEKKAFDDIKSYLDLDNYIEGKFDYHRHNYVLIDEIQEISEWERTVRSLRLEENVDIIITGSNSKMLSSELGTLIGGRYQEIYVQSLTYNEFLQFHKLTDSDGSLSAYLNYGGLPGLVQTGLQDDDLVWDYIAGVRNTIMLKDIVERHNIRNIGFLNNLISFFADTIGKLNSVNNISNYLKSTGVDIASKTISAYLDYFVEAYLISKVQRYDLHGKKILESNDKIYFGDVGLRNFIAGGSRENDIEKVLENIVYQQLVHWGYKVEVGQLRVGEVDFVCTKTNDKRYVQVSYIIADDATREREFGRLESLNDNYRKYVISMTPLVTRQNYNGIIHIGLREFLTRGF